MRFSDLDPPNSYRMSGEGKGGVAGFARGGVSLAEKDGGTLLSYNVEAQIGGKLAQLGQRLINSVTKNTANEFFWKCRGCYRIEVSIGVGARCAPYMPKERPSPYGQVAADPVGLPARWGYRPTER